MICTTTPAHCRQTFIRIRLSLAAYAYELENRTIMSDAAFDQMCLEVDPAVTTGNPRLDRFFAEAFDPSTGVWIHKHPELDRVRDLLHRFYPDA